MRMKKKPDLLAVLVVVVSLGVIATTFAQGMFSDAELETRIAGMQSKTAPANTAIR